MPETIVRPRKRKARKQARAPHSSQKVKRNLEHVASIDSSGLAGQHLTAYKSATAELKTPRALPPKPLNGPLHASLAIFDLWKENSIDEAGVLSLYGQHFDACEECKNLYLYYKRSISGAS